MWQDKYDLLDREGEGLVPWSNKHNKYGFPENQRLEFDVKHIKVSLQQFRDLKEVTWLPPE